MKQDQNLSARAESLHVWTDTKKDDF